MEDKLTLAFAVEGPQTTFGGRGVANGKFYFMRQVQAADSLMLLTRLATHSPDSGLHH